ncbi:serine hydrolase [Roseiterribacter gracilis]|uniref:Serine hydrolase n=1 Tax=Roseiterribacter gracilis TaxID=2812848 RepID=A0A8S8X756_9PROT|nr:serine hydrolase [Rhodospirillales bacterium TMPK1]
MLLRNVVALTSLLLAGTALAAPPEGFDARIEARLKEVGTPGMAIAIVEDGKVTLAKGYGVRKNGTNDKVTADTIFSTGSTGKAFTAAALAILVDEGKIAWDDKVTDRLPGFQMYDPWVTREITIRDLLVHRSGLGLGAGDLMFVPTTNRTRAEAVHALRYIKPATSFRSAYAYDNVLYMVAGQLIEAVTGQTWEVFVRDRVFKPAGMLKSTTDEADQIKSPDHAFPHARLGGPIRGMGDLTVLDEKGLGRAAAPAGGLAISANDMAKWLLIQLNKGKLPDGKALFSEKQAEEMWKPHINLPTGRAQGAMAPSAPQFSSYALGWTVQDWRGHKIIQHGGAVLGQIATVVLIPEKNVAFSILENAEDGAQLLATQYELLDYYLGLPKVDWGTIVPAFRKERAANALAALEKKQAEPAKVGPSLPVARYAGNYADVWYGPINIKDNGGKLSIDFTRTPGMVGTLEHFQYDTFKTVWNDKSMEPAYVTFQMGPEGNIERITMKAVSPIADFSWDYHDLELRPVPPARK